MGNSAPIVDLSPRVRAEFDEACLAILKTRVQRPLAGREPHDVLLGFAAHYQHLRALPRRMRRALERRWKCTLSVIALMMTLGQVPAWAANIEVSPGTPPSINADGKCSLIEAIVNANRNARTHLDCGAGAGRDTIVLPETSTQRLRAQEMLPQITSPIVIEGHQSTILRNWNTSVSANLTFFRVGASGDLTLNETTVSGATATARTYGFGVFNAGGVITLNNSSIVDTRGGLQNTGTAVLEHSAVSGNGHMSFTGFYGGGITNDAGGTLTLRDCVVTGNGGSYFDGGGIHNDFDATATVIDSIVSQNFTMEGNGGGMFNRGTLRLVDSTVSDNTADQGGGINNIGTVTVIRSTISSNGSGSYVFEGGGGIHNGGTLTLTNSTVSSNESNFGGAGVDNSGELTIVSSTVTGNTAWYYGAGLYVEYGGTVTLKRSIVSGNSAPNDTSGGREITISDGAVTADDYNLFGHDGDAGIEGFTPGATDIVPADPVDGLLLPLADNGGGTKTHALAIGSPALDASPDDTTCPTTDQRGNPRPRGPACDIGSFEGVALLCNGKVTTMVGTINDDRLTGTAGPDVISGLIGDDTILALEGNDVVCAGSGADIVYGGPGSDRLFGEPGNDRLFGQGGNDALNGGVGQDQCDGGPGTGDAATTCETVTNLP